MLIRNPILIGLKCVSSVSLIFIYSLTPHRHGGKTVECHSQLPFCSLYFRSTYERFTWKKHLSRYHFHNIFSDSSLPLTESLLLGHLLNCAFHAPRLVIEGHGHGPSQSPTLELHSLDIFHEICMTETFFIQNLAPRVYHSRLRLLWIRKTTFVQLKLGFNNSNVIINRR